MINDNSLQGNHKVQSSKFKVQRIDGNHKVQSSKFKVQSRKIGIFGGSFNPIHVGHIALARQLRQLAGLDEVWLMVSPQNPLKQGSSDLLDDRLRWELAQKALESEEGIVASDYEFSLPKPSYTWNTLQHLSHDFPDRTFLLLLGGDNWAHFERWRHWKDILRHYDVIVYPRENYAGTVDVPLLHVSSTEIRRRVRNGESINGMVPDSIVPLVNQYYLNYLHRTTGL